MFYFAEITKLPVFSVLIFLLTMSCTYDILFPYVRVNVHCLYVVYHLLSTVTN